MALANLILISQQNGQQFRFSLKLNSICFYYSSALNGIISNLKAKFTYLIFFLNNILYTKPRMLSALNNNSTIPITGIPEKSWQPQFVRLETTMGEITVELYWKHAPNTCRNFAELVRRGYYNNVMFHRIIKDFMIQGGDPTETGRGGTSIYGGEFPDEIHPDLKHTGAGILSMANSGPDTNGSQFFFTLAPTQWLDGKHTIFGRVYTGMQVVKRIGMVETDKNDRPIDGVRIVRAKIEWS